MKLTKLIPKPAEGEYAPYAAMYINLVPDDGLVLKHLWDNLFHTIDVVYSLPSEKLTWRFADGEWTVQEILVHVMDTERIWAYRSLRIARADFTPLPGFEQDDYVPPSKANNRTVYDIMEEYEAVRKASLTLFKNLEDEALSRIGTASNNPFSVRAGVYQIAGHEMHHFKSIQENYDK